MLVTVVATALVLLRWGPGAGLFDRETVIETLGKLRQSPWAAPALVVGLALVSPTGLPVTPLLVAGAVVFGVWWGWLLNLTGCMAGGTIGFLLAHSLGRDLVAHTIGGSRLERIQGLIDRHGFWTLARIRFVPIPYGLVNYATALAGMKFSIFFFATLVGLAPTLLVQAFVAHGIVYGAAEGRPALLWGAGATLFVMFGLTWLPGLRRLTDSRGDNS
ncbi:MAG: VTT domain-containing protein [Acidobacteriota bacterium]|nr:VTT domain-containing protein [Acidobacteriota bacterium]